MDETIVNIPKNEILEANPYYVTPIVQEPPFTINMKDLIKNNILADYKNGVTSGTINLFMADFQKFDYLNYVPKEKLNWKLLGELIKVGDVIHITKNGQNYFGDDKWARVTNRELIYDGEVYMKIDFRVITFVLINE